MYERYRFVRQSKAGSWICLFALILSLSPTVSATSFDCEDQNCNLYSQGTYPNLVLGKVVAVASDEQASAVYRWTRQHGYWPTLPDDEPGFLQYVQVMSVVVPRKGKPVELTLLMAREEFETSEIFPGDFVRYTPHTISEPRSSTFDGETARIYWDLFGSIAVLCRADDSACPNRYADGVYRTSDGIELTIDGNTPKSTGQRIDTETYFPL